MSRARSRALSFGGTGPPFLHTILAPRTLASQDSFGTSMNILGAFLVAQMVKKSACSAGDLGLFSGLGRSPGGGHGNPLQYSCLENPMDRGAWRATVHGVTKSWTRLSNSAQRRSIKILDPLQRLGVSILVLPRATNYEMESLVDHLQSRVDYGKISNPVIHQNITSNH